MRFTKFLEECKKQRGEVDEEKNILKEWVKITKHDFCLLGTHHGHIKGIFTEGDETEIKNLTTTILYNQELIRKTVPLCDNFKDFLME